MQDATAMQSANRTVFQLIGNRRPPLVRRAGWASPAVMADMSSLPLFWRHPAGAHVMGSQHQLPSYR